MADSLFIRTLLSAINGGWFLAFKQRRDARQAAMAVDKAMFTSAVVITALDIDWEQGNLFTKALGANSAMTFSNLRNGKVIVVNVTSSGAFTITWPASVKWTGGVEPTMTSGAGKLDSFSFVYDGTNTLGSVLPDMS